MSNVVLELRHVERRLKDAYADYKKLNARAALEKLADMQKAPTGEEK